MGSGSLLPHHYRARPRIVALQHGITICFSKPSSGGWAPVPLGGICPLVPANGTASSAASNGGPSAGCLGGCSRSSVTIPDLESVLSDGAIVPVHQKASGAKGDSASIHWLIPRRAHHKDQGSWHWWMGWALSLVCSPASGADPRQQRRNATDQQCAFWPPAGGQSIWHRLVAHRVGCPRSNSSHPPKVSRKYQRAYDKPQSGRPVGEDLDKGIEGRAVAAVLRSHP